MNVDEFKAYIKGFNAAKGSAMLSKDDWSMIMEAVDSLVESNKPITNYRVDSAFPSVIDGAYRGG